MRSEELLKESSVGYAHAALFDFCFTLREGERVFRSPHPPRSGSPSPQGATAGAVLTSSTTNVVPLPLIGEGLSAL